ncbi:uncharacterized protein LOC123315686 [Coccinella septempunctata]|uniref:uncharacterized protein LOC123315686 n=1 Tax=Coccinella septempunctata TaxID=41139 RepID=UPI001D0986AE|nr:uncharacterized protein LOC123315686 [Coccinella septempunctata]
MHCCWVLSFVFLLDLIIGSDSAHPDFVIKDWMDSCDLKRMKAEGEVPTTKRIKTTRRPIPGGVVETGPAGFRKTNRNPRIDVYAKLDQLVKELKQKLTADAYERGASPEFGEPAVAPRGFGKAWYDMYEDYEQYD